MAVSQRALYGPGMVTSALAPGHAPRLAAVAVSVLVAVLVAVSVAAASGAPTIDASSGG